MSVPLSTKCCGFESSCGHLSPLYLYCECITSWILNLHFFKVRFQTLCSLLNPYRHHSWGYSWKISLVFFYFSVSIQINHEKNLQIYVLCHSCKCEICSKWCRREIYSNLTIKTPLLLFWYLIVNVSVVNWNRYLSDGIMIF